LPNSKENLNKAFQEIRIYTKSEKSVNLISPTYPRMFSIMRPCLPKQDL
jgi:hypothetical protein